MAEVRDHRPFAADHRAEGVVLAAPIFLQVAAAHDGDAVALIFMRFLTAQVEAVDLCIPKLKDHT